MLNQKVYKNVKKLFPATVNIEGDMFINGLENKWRVRECFGALALRHILGTKSKKYDLRWLLTQGVIDAEEETVHIASFVDGKRCDLTDLKKPTTVTFKIVEHAEKFK